MYRSSVTLVVVAVLVCMAGCNLKVEIDNARPTVTWLSVPPATDDGVIDLTVWVYDLERDPVDLTVTWLVGGESQGEIALAPGSHGTVGLATDDTDLGDSGRPNPDGQPHLVRWQLDDAIDDATSLQLRFKPDDGVTSAGRTVYTPEFTADEGLPLVTRLTSP